MDGYAVFFEVWYPELKRAVRAQAVAFNPRTILIEDKASGTQLIQELVSEGLHVIQKYEPTMDKTMRMHSVTSTIENGFAHLPDEAAWLGEYLHELANFPKGKYDDQADSTSQALDWFKQSCMKSPFIEVIKHEHWTILSNEFSGYDSHLPYRGALHGESGRTKFPSFGCS
jgi:predicted phage terminase large subunit-like protein